MKELKQFINESITLSSKQHDKDFASVKDFCIEYFNIKENISSYDDIVSNKVFSNIYKLFKPTLENERYNINNINDFKSIFEQYFWLPVHVVKTGDKQYAEIKIERKLKVDIKINKAGNRIQNIDTLFDMKYSNVNELNIFNAVKSFGLSKNKFSQISKLMKSYGLSDDVDYVAINLDEGAMGGIDTSFINTIFKDDTNVTGFDIINELQSNLELVDEQSVNIDSSFDFVISLYKKGNNQYVFIGFVTDEVSQAENETWDEYYIIKL